MKTLKSITGKKGGKGGGQTASAAQEDPNTLRSVSTARIIDFVSEGQIVGLVDGLKSIYFDGVPIQNSDNSLNFYGVSVEFRSGTPSQVPVRGFSAVENERVVDVEVLQDTPISRTVSDVDVDGVRVKVVIPKLTKQDPENGDLHGYEVEVAIDVQSNGGAWTEIITDKISGKTTSDYERAWRVNKPEGGVPWHFRLRRITLDSDEDATIENSTFFGTYTEIIDAKMSYPNSAYFAITIDADQFGDKLPKRSYDLLGVMIDVPSNYDSENRSYSGIWDGTFQRAWTDNPAWVLYDLITNDRYGLGEFIESSVVNKGQLYEIAQYCDELVSDGRGGLEPRWTFNEQIRKREDAYTLLRKIASVFRGINYFGSGTINFVHDAPSDPVQIVSPSNVIDGKFTYSGASLTGRNTVAVTTYSDPSDGGRSGIDVYEDVDAVARHGWRQKDITAFGCDRRGQARRTGAWEIDDEQFSLYEVRYRCGLDHLYVRPGNIIQIQDPRVAGARLSGRVVSINDRNVVVDHLPNDLGAVSNTVFRLMSSSGDIVERNIDSFDVENNALVLDLGLNNSDFVKGAIWLIQAQEVVPVEYRVTRISEQPGNIYSVSAKQYDRNKHQRIEQGVIVDVPDFTILPSGPIARPTGLNVSEFLYRDGVVVKTGLTASVSSSDDARVSFIQFQYRDGRESNWTPAQLDVSPSLTLRDVRDGNSYRVRVRFISQVGVRSDWVESAWNTVVGKLTPPSRPDGVVLSVDPNSGVRISKSPSQEFDYKETAFFVGGSLASATELFRGAVSDYLWSSPPVGSHLIWVVDYDTGGRESLPASALIEISGPSEPVVVADPDGAELSLTWSSSKTDFAIDFYRVQFESTVVATISALGISIPVTWRGSRVFSVVAVDIAGNESVSGQASLGVLDPDSPSVIAEFSGSDLLLSWSDASTTLPIRSYIITRSGATYSEQSATSILIPVDWGGQRTFGVTAVDTAGNLSQEASVSVSPVEPSAPVVTHRFDDTGVTFSVAVSSGDLPVDRIVIRHQSEVVAEVYSDTWSLPVTWAGARNFQFSQVDSAGNSSQSTLVSVSAAAPDSPVVEIDYAGGSVIMSWQETSTDLPVARYLISHQSAVVAEVTQPNWQSVVGWVGARTFNVVAVDSAGNASAATSVIVNPAPPSSPSFTSDVIDNNVLFKYQATPGSLPIESYELKKGAVFDSAEDFAVKAGNSSFTTLFENSAGTYTYWILARDSAGNLSAPTSNTATVSQPPDFVLFAKYSLREMGWLGTKTNAAVGDKQTLLAPVDVSQTWAQYLSNGYSTLQSEIDAGFSAWPTPAPNSARYEEIIDYGLELSGSLITASLTPDAISGSVTTTVLLSYSQDGVVWVDGGVNQRQIFGLQFRYIRMVVDFVADGDDLVEMEDVQVKLDRKLRSDAGRGTASASDASGTAVVFNAQFVDVVSINVTPRGSSSVQAVYDFVDAPNPTEMFVYLFDSSGNRVSGEFSWSVEGY